MSEFKFSSRVAEVVRTLPQQQQKEIYHNGRLFHEGAQHLEYGVYYHAPSYYREERPAQLLSNVFPKIVDILSWNDLLLADSREFPGLSPKRAMKIGRMATEYVVSLVKSTDGSPDYFDQAATGLVGLHASLLGDETLLDNDTAQSNLAAAQAGFTKEFVEPLAWKGATNMPNIRYVHPPR
jgi:hypothetical protein